MVLFWTHLTYNIQWNSDASWPKISSSNWPLVNTANLATLLELSALVCSSGAFAICRKPFSRSSLAVDTRYYLVFMGPFSPLATS